VFNGIGKVGVYLSGIFKEFPGVIVCGKEIDVVMGCPEGMVRLLIVRFADPVF
jgi:hypothetical protein